MCRRCNIPPAMREAASNRSANNGPAAPPPVAGQKRKRPTFLSMDQAQVEITLKTQGSKSFMVYKELVCFHSEYFRRAFEGPFRESGEKSIEIEDVDERTFRLFQFWLFAQATREEENAMRNEGRVPSRSDRKATSSWQVPKDISFNEERQYYNFFMDLFIFADRYDVPQLRNDIMTILVDLERQLSASGQPLCNRISVSTYTNLLPHNAPFRQYIVRRVALDRLSSKDDEKRGIFFNSLGEDFKTDVLDAILTMPKDQLLTKSLKAMTESACEFHKHKSEEERTLCEGRQTADKAFYVSFFRACMSEVE